MRDLRLRFGLILALALLPLLVFSVWRAYLAYNNDRANDEITMLAVARASTAQLVSAVDTMKDVAQALDPVLGQSVACRDTLISLAQSYSAIDNVLLLGPDNTFQCSAFPINENGVVAYNADLITPQSPFKTGIVWVERGEIKVPALRVIHNIYDGNQIKATVIVGAELENLPLINDDAAFYEGAQIALINNIGQVLIDPNSGFTEFTPDWASKAIFMPGGFWEIDRSDYKRQKMFVLPTTEEEIFIAVKKDRVGLLSWHFLNPLTSGLLPLLSWLFAFCAIWFSADRLILVHLRKLQRSALLLARGDKDIRIGAMDDAPQQIAKLGQVFDLLADRVSTRETTLSEALVEKETLLREIHHRVKNNLQIIISLLNIQERKLSEPSAKHAIDEARNRINAIALVHKGLYEGDDFTGIDMSVFLAQLSAHMGKAMGLRQSGIKINLDIEQKTLDPDTAIPVALFMIEALANSNKHGASRGDEFSVSLTQTTDRTAIVVRDMGRELSVGDVPIAGTGLKLMKGFARQLSGTFCGEQTPDGYMASLTFPTPK